MRGWGFLPPRIRWEPEEMLVKIQIVAEDHKNRIKSPRQEMVIDVPEHMLQESVNPAAQVVNVAKWAASQASSAIQSQFFGMQQSMPMPQMGMPQSMPMPPQMGMPGHRAQQPMRESRGGKEGPRSVDEIISMSAPGLMQANADDRQRGSVFSAPNGGTTRGPGHVGWGPHRSK